MLKSKSENAYYVVQRQDMQQHAYKVRQSQGIILTSLVGNYLRYQLLYITQDIDYLQKGCLKLNV